MADIDAGLTPSPSPRRPASFSPFSFSAGARSAARRQAPAADISAFFRPEEADDPEDLADASSPTSPSSSASISPSSSPSPAFPPPSSSAAPSAPPLAQSVSSSTPSPAAAEGHVSPRASAAPSVACEEPGAAVSVSASASTSVRLKEATHAQTSPGVPVAPEPLSADVAEQIRLLLEGSPDVGPAALAAERRRKGREDAEMAEARFRARCDGKREVEEKKGAPAPPGAEAAARPWNAAEIVNMLVKHDKFVARPKVFFRNGEYLQEEPTQDELVADLQRLMHDSPHVVLERHGECFEAQHLAFFKENFAESPEVQFYINSLQSRSTPEQREKLAANRRLTKLRQLVAEGDFFSEAAMQARQLASMGALCGASLQPALYHELVGRFACAPDTASAPTSSSARSSRLELPLRGPEALKNSSSARGQGGSRGKPLQGAEERECFFSAAPGSLSSCLLSALDNRELRRAARQERAQWRRRDEALLAQMGGKVLQEHREQAEARRLRQAQRREAQDARENRREERAKQKVCALVEQLQTRHMARGRGKGLDDKRRESEKQQDAEEPRAEGIDGESKQEATSEEEHEEDMSVDLDSEEETDDEDEDDSPGDFKGRQVGVAPAEGKRARRFLNSASYTQRREDFLLLMQEKFLLGHDACYVNYAEIDQDESLDDLREVSIPSLRHRRPLAARVF
ncbi:hypothetical protein BESB_021840 [Besnoitia besnoiti]|uniref:CCD97-like C-terminal domain-containing protein n=1 Tax=Besnoitia besnoiti TaxID=94643 RepID=A0A2A9M985_BESBE|nr:hypothetical protein BESB_021840 [Besnoitia besnoiti]PFH32243.1 hypothetical protein BESB_021840 [Besnoitia besnoiti]